MKLTKVLFFISIISVITACSDVEFTPQKEFLSSHSLEFTGVRINNGDAYTRNQDVKVDMLAESADEMYVTDDPTCTSGGEWMAYEPQVDRHLLADNSEGHVYAKFRNRYKFESPCVSDSIVHDNVPPELSWTQTPSALNNHKVDKLAYQATDATSGVHQVYCKTSAGQLQSCELESAGLQTSEGGITFQVSAVDRAGNASPPILYAWQVDLTAPKVEWKSRPSLWSAKKIESFEVEATDPNGVKSLEWSVDGQNYVAGSSFHQMAVQKEGQSKMYVTATDEAGNRSSPSNYFWWNDWTPPVVKLTKTPDEFDKNKMADFEFEVQDNLSDSQARCKTEGLTFVNCAKQFKTTSLNDGAQAAQFVAVDLAGNESEVVEKKWTIDSTGPVIKIDHNLANITNLGSGELRHEISDAIVGVGEVTCSADGQAAVCGSTGVKAVSRPTVGYHKYKIEAKDKLGNLSQLEVKWYAAQATQERSLPLQITSQGDVDVLVVVDNSASMENEQNEMANRFNLFLDVLKDLSWQVGVTTTDVVNRTKNYADGKLIPMDKTKSAYLTYKMNIADANSDFVNAVKRNERGSAEEQGVAATYRAIERMGESSDHKKFFRQDSHLAVILVSDENESKAETKNKPEELVKKVKQVFGEKKKFKYHSIVTRSGDTVCKSNTDHQYGAVYEAASKLTNGLVGDICAQNYTSQLLAVGEDIKKEVQSFKLECAPWDVDNNGQPDVEVIFANTSTQINFVVKGDLIEFERVLPVGNHSIKYHCPVF